MTDFSCRNGFLPNGSSIARSPIILRSTKIYTGCNIYHTSTVIRLRVDFQAFSQARTDVAWPSFAQAFLARFGGLESFRFVKKWNDRFISDLQSSEGAAFSDILLEAILAVERSIAFAKHEVNNTLFAEIRRYGAYTDLIWETTHPKLSRQAALVALQGLLELLPDGFEQAPMDASWNEAFNKLVIEARSRTLSASTSVIKLAAKMRGIPCVSLGRQHLLLGQGVLQQRTSSSMSGTTSVAAKKLCADKRRTARQLAAVGLPVPSQAVVDSLEAAHRAAEELGYPVTIKPPKGRQGVGVTAGLAEPQEVERAFERARQFGPMVLMESHISGDDHRLLVIGRKFIAAVKRLPPTIIGDGRSTVTALIEQLNADPYRDGFCAYPIEMDAELFRMLDMQELAIDEVLAKGRKLTLRSVANVSTGGIAIDVTDEVHRDNRKMAELAADVVGLDVAGIDFLTTDISRSYRDAGGAIVEINVRPGLDLHIWPKSGVSRDAAGEMLKLSFPPGDDGRIPTAVVAGDRGIGTTARMLDRILRAAGRSVALVLHSQAFVNGSSAGLTSKQQKRAPLLLLRDPQVETLVSAVSLRQVAKRGMLLDRCQLSIVMEPVKNGDEDLFRDGLCVVTKATTACFVVNARHSEALDIISSTEGNRLILVGERLDDPRLRAHLKGGGDVVTILRDGGDSTIALVSGSEVVAKFSLELAGASAGLLTPRNLEALMYAIGGAHGMGMSGSEIYEALINAPTIIPDAA